MDTVDGYDVPLTRTAASGVRGPLPRKRERIASWVRRKIALGSWRPGERLPDRTWFERHFATTSATVQLAFAELRDEAFVTAVRGHGTRVADPLPFAGRYLILCNGTRERPSENLFASALRAGAEEVSRRRGVSFVIEGILDERGDSPAMLEVMDAVRRQRYSGVFFQNLGRETGERAISNISHVPMSGYALRDERAQGTLFAELRGFREAEETCMRAFFADCRASGAREVAVFLPVGHHFAWEARCHRLAESYGLAIMREAFHTIPMNEYDPKEFARLATLFLKSDARRTCDAVVLGDDNFVRPFTDAVRALPQSLPGGMLLEALCHPPLYPRTSLPFMFHGFDTVTMLESFVDYAEACHAGIRHPEPASLSLR